MALLTRRLAHLPQPRLEQRKGRAKKDEGGEKRKESGPNAKITRQERRSKWSGRNGGELMRKSRALMPLRFVGREQKASWTKRLGSGVFPACPSVCLLATCSKPTTSCKSTPAIKPRSLKSETRQRDRRPGQRDASGTSEQAATTKRYPIDSNLWPCYRS